MIPDAVIDSILEEYYKVMSIDDADNKDFFQGYLEGLKFSIKELRQV